MSEMNGGIANRIIRDADGTLSCPECGCILNDVRSIPAHRLFFGFLKHAFESWPDGAEFVPDNPEHLRAWALVQAGHRAPQYVFRFANKRELQIVQGFVSEEMRVDRARGVYGWPVMQDGGLTILRPASIAFDKLSQKKFNQITESVFKVIRDYAGIDFDEWKRMGKAA